MIRFIKGVLAEKSMSSSVIDVNGIGYEVIISQNTYQKLPSVGKYVVFYTHFYIRETSQELYGFTSTEERDLFQKLLTVNDVGPKIALSILSVAHPLMFRKAVLENDIHFLTTIPGIGKKTAEKVILELKGKIKDWVIPGDRDDTEQVVTKTRNVTDAIAGLVGLGYKEPDARDAVEAVDTELTPNSTAEEIITIALRKFGNEKRT
ncbi:MAG: Holliday junction branch migration protein RuvA [Elusimicrobiota bacterium]